MCDAINSSRNGHCPSGTIGPVPLMKTGQKGIKMSNYGVWKCVILTNGDTVKKVEVVATSGKAVKAMVAKNGDEVLKMERVATMDYFQRNNMREALTTKYSDVDTSRIMQLMEFGGMFDMLDTELVGMPNE